MTYAEKLRDPRWQKKRLEVMKRDKFTCRDCGATDKTLHVHHCFYEKGNPWETGSALMLTLCDKCHESRGELETQGKRALGFIFAKMVNAKDDDELRYFVNEMSLATNPDFLPRIIDDVELYDLWRRAQGLKK